MAESWTEREPGYFVLRSEISRLWARAARRRGMVMLLSLGVEIGSAERCTVFRAEIEGLSNLNTAMRGELTLLTTRTVVPGLRLTNIRKGERWQVSLLIKSRQMIITFVSAADQSLRFVERPITNHGRFDS